MNKVCQEVIFIEEQRSIEGPHRRRKRKWILHSNTLANIQYQKKINYFEIINLQCFVLKKDFCLALIMIFSNDKSVIIFSHYNQEEDQSA